MRERSLVDGFIELNGSGIVIAVSEDEYPQHEIEPRGTRLFRIGN